MGMKTLILTISICLCVVFAGEVSAEDMISVRLKNYIGNTSKISFKLQGDYLTLDPSLQLNEGETYTLSLKNGKMYLRSGHSKIEIEQPFVLYPYTYDDKHLVSVNGKPYMGAIEFQVEKGKNIRPINQLLLEDYLTGVVPFEVYPDWHLDALKAQTLAARTYTITHKTAKLDDTTHYQVYGGYNQFTQTTKAVKETAGEIITYEDKPINAYYSASNGGITETDEHVWGGKPSPYFSIKEDPYDPIQPWNFTLHKTQINWEGIQWDHSNWWDELQEKDEVISSNMKKWLNDQGYTGDIKILNIPLLQIDDTLNESQRSLKGSIEFEFMQRLIDGTILFDKISLIDVELKKIRPIIGAASFKSYLVTSFESGEASYQISGKGHGHGVGMSQWGANEMAKKGKNYQEIIKHYYTGTSIKSTTTTTSR